MTPVCAVLTIVLLGPAEKVDWKFLRTTIPRAQKVCLKRYGRYGNPCLKRLFVYKNGRDYYAECGLAAPPK